MYSKIVLVVLSVLCVSFIHAQDDIKFDYIWLTGYASWGGDTAKWGGTIIDFHTLPPTVSYEYRDMDFRVTNASICDSIGNLLFYTNGIYVADASGDTMLSGVPINPDPYTQSWNAEPLQQGALILPLPESKHIYYLIHEELTFTPNPPDYVKVPRLRYSIIDIKGNNDLGAVLEKNIVAIEDTLGYGQVTTTRHANGRDWWILISKYKAKKYYTLSLTPDGLEKHSDQYVNDTIRSGIGQAVFSPDGKIFARVNMVSNSQGGFLDIYDFDRCTGLLSNHKQIFYPLPAASAGVAISPNNRYLYLSFSIYVFQYDLYAPDIEASIDTVGYLIPDSTSLPATFFLAQLAPDSNIYINASNTIKYMHVIEEPDKKGDSCLFINKGLELATLNAFSMPNFPNYRLGTLKGSACDTIYVPPVADFGHRDSALHVAFQDSSQFSPDSWHWSFGDGDTSTLQHPEHTYMQQGSYVVCLTASNAYGNDVLCDTVVVRLSNTGNPKDIESTVRVYPNPVQQIYTVVLPEAGPGNIQLYDATGREVQRIKIGQGERVVTCSSVDMATGVYFGKVLLGKTEYVFRLVKL